MLQRSPSYIIALPTEDPIARIVQRRLPPRAAYWVMRAKGIILTSLSYRLSRRWPKLVRRLLRAQAKKLLPANYDIDTHFNPSYNPWDQRLCVVPGGDLYTAIGDGKATVVTDQIESFTKNGIRLRSGDELAADIVVTATGLNLLAFGGMQLTIDGEELELPEAIAYKGMMLSGVPNFAFALGYTNASWTLKVDLVAGYMCRLLKRMDKLRTPICVAQVDDQELERVPLLDFTSGYVLRSIDKFPKQGTKKPWRLDQSYPHDLVSLRLGSLDDARMKFVKVSAQAPAAEVA